MNKKELFEFRVGDIVRDFRFDGEFELSYNTNNTYPLQTPFGYTNYASYTINGKQHSSHDGPVLTLVRRPSKKKNVTWYRVSYHEKCDGKKPNTCNELYKYLEDFLNFYARKKSDFHWIELEPVRLHEYEVENEGK